jgi:hypothetical protein
MMRFGMKLLRDERGFAAAEFALWLPLMVLILFGCFEATRYILIHQKLDRAATQVADLVGQAEALTNGQLDDIYNAAVEQMSPYDLDGEGKIIISSILGSGSTNQIMWQRTHGSGGGSSEVGTAGGVAVLPDNFYLTANENTIAAEILYNYEPVFFGVLSGMKNLDGSPLFGNMFQATTFRHDAWARPRSATLVTVPAS